MLVSCQNSKKNLIEKNICPDIREILSDCILA